MWLSQSQTGKRAGTPRRARRHRGRRHGQAIPDGANEQVRCGIRASGCRLSRPDGAPREGADLGGWA